MKNFVFSVSLNRPNGQTDETISLSGEANAAGAAELGESMQGLYEDLVDEDPQTIVEVSATLTDDTTGAASTITVTTTAGDYAFVQSLFAAPTA